jgi:hypothetical protein
VDDDVTVEVIHTLKVMILPEVMKMPRELLAVWAEGAWPEPFCGVCRGMDKPWGAEGWPDEDALYYAVKAIVEWHDAPMRKTNENDPYKVRANGGRLTMLRCRAIYDAAREVLAT